MRDIGRLDGFYDEVKRIHAENFPDWRFGQLMLNFFSAYASEGDAFYWEENDFLEKFRRYASETTRKTE